VYAERTGTGVIVGEQLELDVEYGGRQHAARVADVADGRYSPQWQ
jgi:hypothetical protein